MALKKKISATAYEALNEALKSEYTLVGEDYILDVDGDDRPTQADLDALKQAKQHEKEARQTAERELKALKAAGEGNSTEAQQLREELESLNTRLSSRDNALKKTALEAAASKVTVKSKFPTAMLPNVLTRLDASIDDSGQAVVTVLGADGKPSKMTLDELVVDFQKNKEFEGLMLGSAASGGGNLGDPADGGNKAIKDMSESERVAAAQADPKGFAAKVAAETPTV